jgi:hypothetical protein
LKSQSGKALSLSSEDSAQRLSEQRLLQNTDGRFLEKIFLRVRDCHQPRFGRMLEVMMAASDSYQIPAVRNELAYQKSAIHITSLWCACGYYTYWLFLINTITTKSSWLGGTAIGIESRRPLRTWLWASLKGEGWVYCEVLRAGANKPAPIDPVLVERLMPDEIREQIHVLA